MHLTVHSAANALWMGLGPHNLKGGRGCLGEARCKTLGRAQVPTLSWFSISPLSPPWSRQAFKFANSRKGLPSLLKEAAIFEALQNTTPQKKTDSRWFDHPGVQTLQGLLRLVRHLKPRSGIIENVQGIRVTDPGCHSSPLQFVHAELQLMGYSSLDIDIDLQVWHGVVRQRFLHSGHHPQIPHLSF